MTKKGGKLLYPRPFIDYLVYFHSFRDYFECHEILEEHWKQQGQSNPIWVGFIQLAVAMYHHRRQNLSGATKQLASALKIIEKEKKQVQKLGIDQDVLIKMLEEKLEEIHKGISYSPIDLPINDQRLLDLCIKKSQENKVTWGSEVFVTHSIIHKHKTRDRSAIIKEREEQLNKRRNN